MFFNTLQWPVNWKYLLLLNNWCWPQNNKKYKLVLILLKNITQNNLFFFFVLFLLCILFLVRTDIALQFDCSFGYKAAFGNHTKGVLLLKVGNQGFCGPGFFENHFPSQCMLNARYKNKKGTRKSRNFLFYFVSSRNINMQWHCTDILTD